VADVYDYGGGCGGNVDGLRRTEETVNICKCLDLNTNMTSLTPYEAILPTGDRSSTPRSTFCEDIVTDLYCDNSIAIR
jgi:hypothetical protein